MKLIKTASGKKIIKMSQSEWENIGKEHGWMYGPSFSVGDRVAVYQSISPEVSKVGGDVGYGVISKVKSAKPVGKEVKYVYMVEFDEDSSGYFSNDETWDEDSIELEYNQ